MEFFPLTARWFNAVLDHPLVREWLNEADRLPYIWFDDYLVPEEPWDVACEVAATEGDEHA